MNDPSYLALSIVLKGVCYIKHIKLILKIKALGVAIGVITSWPQAEILAICLPAGSNICNTHLWTNLLDKVIHFLNPLTLLASQKEKQTETDQCLP